MQLRRERAGAHPRGVRLEDADHRGDPGRADAGPGAGPAGGRVGRGDERVGAVVDVQQRALGALQQHGLAALQGLVEQQPGVGDPVREVAALRQHGVHHLVGRERLAVVDLDQHLVLEVQRGLDLLPQDLLVEQVLGAHPDPGDLVLVAGADAAAGGADLGLAEVALGHFVDGDVVRHDQVRVGGEQQPRGVHAALLQPGQLTQQRTRIHHHTVADDVGHSLGEDARRDELEGEVLAVGQHHGVPGVVAALVADDPLDVLTEQVGGLALAFVAPLRPDQHDGRHVKLPGDSTDGQMPVHEGRPGADGARNRVGLRKHRDRQSVAVGCAQ